MKGRRILGIGRVAGRHLLRLASSQAVYWATFGRRGVCLKDKVPQELRECLEELGPTFIKFGQLISVRPDLANPAVIFEMEKLQENVPPFPFTGVEAVFKREFGRSVSDCFEDFDPQPFAAGSMAQAHRATLKGGTPVAVKVQRPGAEESVSLDLEIGAALAGALGRLRRFRVIDPVALLDEFRASLTRELDFRIEGRHADRFAFNFRNSDLVKIPKVHWDVTSKRVLTLEFVVGWRLTEIDKARAQGIDTYRLALMGAQAFMQQVLADGFFHADLHPANMFIMADGRIVYLDFGIVGYLSRQERGHVTRILYGLVCGDMTMAATHAQALGVSVADGDMAGVLEEVSALLSTYMTSRRDASIGHFGRELLGVLHRHKVRLPANYGLLIKSLITVEGVSKAIYPEINMLEVARPYVTSHVTSAILAEVVIGRLVRLVGVGDRQGPLSGLSRIS